MAKATRVSLSTLARYADPGQRWACPIVGIPIADQGRTLIMRRHLLQAALTAPTITKAYFNGDGRLYLEGERARYSIALLTPDWSVRREIEQWAETRRRQLQRPALPATARKQARLEKARLALEAETPGEPDPVSSYRAVAELHRTATPAPRPEPVPAPEPLPRVCVYLLPAQKFGTVRVFARSLDAAIECYENGVVDFDWQEDPGDDPELIRPAVASIEGTDTILAEGGAL